MIYFMLDSQPWQLAEIPDTDTRVAQQTLTRRAFEHNLLQLQQANHESCIRAALRFLLDIRNFAILSDAISPGAHSEHYAMLTRLQATLDHDAIQERFLDVFNINLDWQRLLVKVQRFNLSTSAADALDFIQTYQDCALAEGQRSLLNIPLVNLGVAAICCSENSDINTALTVLHGLSMTLPDSQQEIADLIHRLATHDISPWYEYHEAIIGNGVVPEELMGILCLDSHGDDYDFVNQTITRGNATMSLATIVDCIFAINDANDSDNESDYSSRKHNSDSEESDIEVIYGLDNDEYDSSTLELVNSDDGCYDVDYVSGPGF